MNLSIPFSSSLQSLIEKLFPREIESVAKKTEGNQRFAQGKYKEAIELYTEALALSKSFCTLPRGFKVAPLAPSDLHPQRVGTR